MPGSRSLPLLRLFGIRVGVELLVVPRPLRGHLRALGLALGDARRERDDGLRRRGRGGRELLRLDRAARARACARRAARGHRRRGHRPVPVRRRDEDEPGDGHPGRRVPRRRGRPGGDAADHGARLRRRGPAGRRGLVLGRGAALRRGRRDARRGRRLAARLDEPRAARVQPRARVPARRRPDRARRRLEADRRPPPGHALRRPHRDRLRLLADAARRAGDRRVGLGRRVRRASGSARSAGCSPRPRAGRSPRASSPSRSPASPSPT